jgi:hypothetical protein
MRGLFARIIMLLLAIGWTGAAHANALSDSWKCAKNAGLSSASIGKDLYKKGEALAKDAGPLSVCLARTGPEGQALAVTSSAITALRLAKPSLLGDKCESRIKSVATVPFGQGLSALMPASGAKTKLLSAINSENGQELFWAQLSQTPPPFSSVQGQIECGCLISDSALSLTDISEITNAVAKTSQTCAAMLDSLGLGFINDIGSYAGKLAKGLAYGASDKWDEWVSGQSNPAPPGAVFESFYGTHLDQLAIAMANSPNGWQAQKYNNNNNWGCNYNMNSGRWEGQCSITLDQLTALCADYYDEHKMSASNGKKTCNAFKDTLLAAATPKSKQYAAIAQLPMLYSMMIGKWLKDEWLWRMPKTYTPGIYNYDNGSVSGWVLSDPQAQSLRNEWSEIVGSPYKTASSAKPGEVYQTHGILAISRALVVEVGNDPALANALAFASVTSPLQDRVRKAWNDNRKGVALYTLREWLPAPTFGFRYGCASGDIMAACATAIEAKFDKMCFTPLAELYVTGTMGFGFPARYASIKNKCMEQISPILAAAAKLESNVASATQGMCTERATREEQASCNATARKSYYECAAVALKQGKNDASQCLAARQLGNDILKQLQKGTKPPPAPAPVRPSRKQ